MVTGAKTPCAGPRSAPREATPWLSQAADRPSPGRGLERLWTIAFLLFQNPSMPCGGVPLGPMAAPRSARGLKGSHAERRGGLWRPQHSRSAPTVGREPRRRPAGPPRPPGDAAHLRPVVPGEASQGCPAIVQPEGPWPAMRRALQPRGGRLALRAGATAAASRGPGRGVRALPARRQAVWRWGHRPRRPAAWVV